MSLTIHISFDSKPIPKKVKPTEVVRQARQAGLPNADRALAVTRAFVRVNQKMLNYDERVRFKPNASQKEYSFKSGALLLRIWQTMHIAQDLTPCAQKIWIKHEQKHVRDHMGLRKRLEDGIKANSYLKTIFFEARWFPYTKPAFEAMQAKIEKTIGDILNEIVLDEAKKRDTQAEYARIRKEIFKTCPDKYYHEVERGESLSKISLFYYGSYRFWPSIYDVEENKKKIGSDPNYITPGQRLLIPKNPKMPKK